MNWIRIYVYTAPVLHEETGERLLPPTWGPVKGEPIHATHPETVHPDPRVRLARAKETTRLTACGKEYDPRLVYIEAHDETERCASCASAVDAARTEHTKAAAVLAEARAKGRT